MVSLNARDSQFRQGGFFLQSQTDDSQMSGRESLAESISADHRLLTADAPAHGFWPLPSIWVGAVELVLILGYIAAAFVCTFATNGKPDWPNNGDLDPPFAFFMALHGVMWLVVALCDRLIQVFHQKVRMRGYLDFYRRNRLLRRMPFVVYSGGNAVLLVLMQFMGCPKDNSVKWEGMHRMTVLLVVIGAENAIALPSLIYYLVRVWRFNRACSAPDIDSDLQPLLGRESSSAARIEPTGGAKELGLREGDYLDDVLEKQADMIRYLQQHNSNLARHINHLTSRGLR